MQVPHDGILLSPSGELTSATIANILAARLAKVLGVERLGPLARDYLIARKAAEGFTRAEPGSQHRLP